MMPAEGEPKPHWTLDRRIPVALIFAIAVQTAGFGYWVGTLSTRVDNAESWIADNRKLDSRLSVLESHMADIKRLLERLAERQAPSR